MISRVYYSFLLLIFGRKVLSTSDDICEGPCSETFERLSHRISCLEQPVWRKIQSNKSWIECNTGVCSCTEPKTSGSVDCWGRLNEFNKIPESQIIPMNVEFIDLGNNHIPFLHPYLFKGFDKLCDVNLFGMGLKYLPQNLFETNQRLRNIKLQDNMIKNIGVSTFKDLQELEYLDLSGNFLEDIPEDLFRSNQRVKIINLSHNKLTIPANLFYNLSRLEVLDLSQNRLANIENDTLRDLRSLNKLFLSRNKIDFLPKGIFSSTSSLVSLDLSFNLIRALPQDFGDNLNNLKYLFLTGNRIRSLKDSDPLPLGVHRLDLSNNDILSPFLHESHYGWVHLDLSNNAIRNYSLSTLHNLQSLKLNGNQIRKINFASLPKSIKQVHFHSNLLEEISDDRDFHALTSLTKITMVNNFWACNCRLGEFVRWMNELGVEYDEATCESPDNKYGLHINQTKTLIC